LGDAVRRNAGGEQPAHEPGGDDRVRVPGAGGRR
jgi:hypothetical protein